MMVVTTSTIMTSFLKVFILMTLNDLEPPNKRC